jgi:hypothetical protein
MPAPITVLTWLWSQPQGRTKYTAEHVNIWADMARRNLSLPHKLACVTNTPAGIDPSIEIIEPPRDFEAVRIPTWIESRPQCLRRLAMFRPDAAEIFGERFVCMDLDCVIGGSLDSFFDTDADFKMTPGTRSTRPYNGSMMLLTAGARPQVYEQFTQEGAAKAGELFVGSDQAWISHILGPGEQVWGLEDGLAWYGRPKPKDMKLMFFPCAAKPWEIAMVGRNSWIAQNYRRSPCGKALVLGYEDNLWVDVERAMASGTYDAVISSPEAAEYWPGEICAIVRTNEEAAMIARMHGLEPTWCGVRELEAA